MEVSLLSKAETQKNIGANVKLLRQARGLTQEQLAQAVGVSIPYFSQIEGGKRFVHTYVLYKLAVVLNTSLDVLVFGVSYDAELSQVAHLLQGCSKQQMEQVAQILNVLAGPEKSLAAQ